MALLLLAPALAANPPAYHRRALVEPDNLDLSELLLNQRSYPEHSPSLLKSLLFHERARLRRLQI